MSFAPDLSVDEKIAKSYEAGTVNDYGWVPAADTGIMHPQLTDASKLPKTWMWQEILAWGGLLLLVGGTVYIVTRKKKRKNNSQ